MLEDFSRPRIPQEGQCRCGRPLPTPAFEPDAAAGLDAVEVRRRWPRLDHACLCGQRTILYASFEHMLAGDW